MRRGRETGGLTLSTHTHETRHIVRRRPSASQGQRPQEKPDLLTPCPWTFRLQNCCENKFLSFKPPAYGSASRLMRTGTTRRLSCQASLAWASAWVLGLRVTQPTPGLALPVGSWPQKACEFVPPALGLEFLELLLLIRSYAHEKDFSVPVSGAGRHLRKWSLDPVPDAQTRVVNPHGRRPLPPPQPPALPGSAGVRVSWTPSSKCCWEQMRF